MRSRDSRPGPMAADVSPRTEELTRALVDRSAGKRVPQSGRAALTAQRDASEYYERDEGRRDSPLAELWTELES